jgi:cytochrome c oxidase assembly factor CtaG
LPIVLLVGVALGLVYAVGVQRVPRRWPWTRTAAFLTGCAVLVAAGTLPGSGFTAHMTEHVLIGLVAPILLALGAPITLALQATDGAGLRRLLRSRIVRVVTHPIVAWTLFGATLVALVFSPLLEWSVRNDAVHGVVHAHFLLVGSLFAATLLAIDPIPHPLPHGGRLLAVLLAVPFHAFVGVALLTARRPLFPDVYPSLADQHSAAAVLWSSGELLTLAVAGIVFARWWAAEQRAAVRIDRQLASQA